MTITEAVKAVLEQERKDLLQREIADRHQITQSYVNNLLSGKRDVSQITLGTFSRMFPRAEVFLDGAPGGITQTATADHHSTVTQNAAAPAPDTLAAAVEAYRHRLQDALIEADFAADTLKAVLNIVKSTK